MPVRREAGAIPPFFVADGMPQNATYSVVNYWCPLKNQGIVALRSFIEANMPLREAGLPLGVSEPLILKEQAIYSLSVAVVSGCLPLFAELAQQIGGVAQRAEGLPNHCGAVKSALCLFSPHDGESGNPSVPLGHLPY